MNDPTPIIQTRGLTRRFQSGPKTITVLDDVTLSVNRGEFVAKGFEDPVRIYEVSWRSQA